MSERERLIEIIVTAENEVFRAFPYTNSTKRIEMVADYLLENNVFVAPVTEGDSVYIILLGHILPFDVISVTLFRKTLIFKAQHGLNLTWVFKMEDFGKTVFLTREEAENALKESEQK